jgi:outer membrane protein assembly factor BamB
MSAPVAEGNYLYVTTFAGTLFKFNQETGEILSAKGMRATSAPVLTNNGMIVSQRADMGNERVSEAIAVIGYGTTNNTKQFQKRDAPYLDKTVQAKSSLKSDASSMDAGNGFTGGAPENSGWKSANDNIGQSNVSTLQSFQGSRILNFSNQNYNTMGNELICSDPATGKTKWKVKLDGDLNEAGGFLGTPPISAGNSIIVATYNGNILVMDSQTGKVNEQFDTHESIRYQPVVEDGWIYVTSTSGKLIAINTKNKNITGWPQWGGNAERSNRSK